MNEMERITAIDRWALSKSTSSSSDLWV